MKPFPRVLALLVLLWSPLAAAEPDWARTHTRRRVEADGVVAIHVIVPLCSNAQIHCGSRALGLPGSLRTNLYWGALYGAKRFLGRGQGAWEALADQDEPEGVLERVAFRREVSGEAWGRRDPAEVLVVLDAIHGNRIDDAVERFFRRATEGGSITIEDRQGERTLPVVAAGYAGHNRLMDGLKLPRPRARGRGIPSFVLACLSRRFFADALVDGGSRPLVTTESFMAPEGYLIDAIATAIGRGGSAVEVRRAAVGAYAKWQRIGRRSAARVFLPSKG